MQSFQDMKHDSNFTCCITFHMYALNSPANVEVSVIIATSALKSLQHLTALAQYLAIHIVCTIPH